jgi:hypothetical protein
MRGEHAPVHRFGLERLAGEVGVPGADEQAILGQESPRLLLGARCGLTHQPVLPVPVRRDAESVEGQGEGGVELGGPPERRRGCGVAPGMVFRLSLQVCLACRLGAGGAQRGAGDPCQGGLDPARPELGR